MVHYCVIKNRKAMWTQNTALTFHRFPPVDSEIFQIWLNHIPMHLIKKYEKYTSLCICSKYFVESDYLCSSSKRQLKKTAFPKIFEQDPTSTTEYSVWEKENLILRLTFRN
ncbi:hypothetical protein DMN91_011904 [Ooceraea biroi]|uniref:THAP-type domain-containing protein n=1 Tax=Ooceraea biroi TaxID=2015173 RepID=A0A3L8D6P6_OOCBI|nr:hypothetical protein DMN91_011904 [Ooceraea biroi]